MRHFHRLPACALLLSLPALTLGGGPIQAQEAPAPRLTLAQALAALEAPRQDLFVTVGADKIDLPPDVPPPDPTDRPAQVGAAYGRFARDFGGVTALGPPTMVVLNTHLGVPDPYDGMPAEDALKLLLAGLTPPQWAALTGQSGLGMADLSDDAQRGLFVAVLPSGDVSANPQATDGPLPASVKLTAQDLRAARLRLGRQTRVLIPMEGKPNSGQGFPPASLDGKMLYTASSPDPPPDRDTAAFGAVLRQTLANNPKESDLDYDAASLKRSVRVDGIATVGDLVARVGNAAGLELYADRRYETRRVTLAGRRTARGVDLLRAAAFCVTGTFRKVGPAYVLTDDREGTATRRQRLARFMQEAEMKRAAALSAAGDALLTAHSLDALPALDGLGLSDAQRSPPADQAYVAGSPVHVPFALLTPAQQEYAAGRVRQVNEEADRANQAGGHVDRLTLAGQFTLEAQPFLFLQTPAVPGPVELMALNAHSFSLFQPSIGAMVRLDRLRMVDRLRLMAAAGKTRPPAAAPPSLAPLLARFPRRAFLVAPRTAREVDRVVGEMKALGLNQLWLEVFSGGHSRLDPDKGGPDILTEALARTKGTDITVVPALDLLRWSADAPPEACDRTALGETSAEQQAWQQHYTDITLDLPTHPAARPVPADVWACPAAPAVEQPLLALVRRLATTPGVTTLALRDTVPPTYNHPPGAGIGNFSDNSNQDLGFVPALRLSLLRRDHVDSLDMGVGFDVRLILPEFDDWNALGNPAREWNTIRDEVSRALLRHLLAASREASGHQFRFLVQQRGYPESNKWYGLWDDPHAPLPEEPSDPPGLSRLPSDADDARAAHAQCPVTLNTVPGRDFRWPPLAARNLQALAPGWDGVVIDAGDPSGGDPLAVPAGGVKR